MSDTIDLGDDGCATFRVGQAEARVDLFCARDRLLDHHEKSKGLPREDYYRGVAEVAASLGLPTLSFKQAYAFEKAVFAACEEAKKNGGGPAASPASTASTPGA